VYFGALVSHCMLKYCDCIHFTLSIVTENPCTCGSCFHFHKFHHPETGFTFELNCCESLKSPYTLSENEVSIFSYFHPLLSTSSSKISKVKLKYVIFHHSTRHFHVFIYTPVTKTRSNLISSEVCWIIGKMSWMLSTEIKSSKNFDRRIKFKW
jgi:hypothetical protein